MTEVTADDALLELAKNAWNRYLDAVDGWRPDLFRYCRRLTGNPWDAEDLAHDALEQAFARLGTMTHGIENPRAYLVRVASNIWVSRQRRERLSQSSSLPLAAAPAPDSSSDVRDASATLLEQLAPQERAALVLKEVFDFTLAEIAEALGTTEGAVKAALHRGRVRLQDCEEPPRHVVSNEVIERFVERYNARDLPGMLALMLDHAAIDMLGQEQQIGRAVWGKKRSWFYYNLWSPFDGKPVDARWEVAFYWGEPVVLVQGQRAGRLAVTSVMRIESEDQFVSRIRVYAMCPDTVREVAAALGRPCATLGWYRLPREIVARISAAASWPACSISRGEGPR